MENKKKLNVDGKITYDDIVNVRKDVSELESKKNVIPTMKFVCLSLIVLAIIFGSLLLFRFI